LRDETFKIEKESTNNWANVFLGNKCIEDAIFIKVGCTYCYTPKLHPFGARGEKIRRGWGRWWWW
jgi:hypothetical protein